MSHSALLAQILDLPDAPRVVEELAARLEAEKKRRAQFYDEIDESMKEEFINGEMVVHSPVMKRHNKATGLLYKLIDTYVYKHQLGFVGFEKIMTGLTRNDYEPDIVFFEAEKSQYFKEDQTLFPAPDFVVEVLSNGTTKRDRGIKFDDYEAHQIPEYWIVDPEREVIEQYLMKNGQYELMLKSSNGTVKSAILGGLEIPIRAIFEDKLNFEILQSLI